MGLVVLAILIHKGYKDYIIDINLVYDKKSDEGSNVRIVPCCTLLYK